MLPSGFGITRGIVGPRSRTNNPSAEASGAASDGEARDSRLQCQAASATSKHTGRVSATERYEAVTGVPTGASSTQV
jgi:hypothetical protein